MLEIFFLPCYVIPGLRNKDQPSSRSAQHPFDSSLKRRLDRVNNQRHWEITSQRDRGRFNSDEFRFRCVRHVCQDHLYIYSWQWDDWYDFTNDVKSIFPVCLSRGKLNSTKIISIVALIFLAKEKGWKVPEKWLTWASTQQDIQVAAGSWRDTLAQVRHSQLQVCIAWQTGIFYCFRRRRICPSTRSK